MADDHPGRTETTAIVRPLPNSLKTREEQDETVDYGLVNLARIKNFANFVNFEDVSKFWKQLNAELELGPIDFQGFDPAGKC